MKELYNALKKFQDTCPKITKDAENPFFKSSYADLAGIWHVIQPILSKNGLIVLQPVVGENVETSVIHVETGDKITSSFPIVFKSENNPQDFGSAVTYARRYSLQAILSIVAEEDDDGEAATNHSHAKPENEGQKKWKETHDKVLNKLIELMPVDTNETEKKNKFTATCRKVFNDPNWKFKKLEYFNLTELNTLWDEIKDGGK